MHEPGVTQYFLIALAGLAGSFHCVGMCGGFVCALGRAPAGTGAATALRHLAYNTGRVASYVFLGSLAGLLGAKLFASGGDGSVALTGQRVLALLAGVLMIVMGLQLLGLLRRVHAGASWLVGNGFVNSLRALLHAPGFAAPLAFGVFNGFLPCPLVYAFLSLAAATADPVRGALLMAVFGLGTFPAMLLSGGLGTSLSWRWRLRGVSVAGAFVVALGAITLARGVLPPDLHAGHVSGAVSANLHAPPPAANANRGGHAH